MKTHFKVRTRVSSGYEKQAKENWAKEGLIHGYEKLCDGLMMTKDNSAYLSSDENLVDCKRCIKIIQNWDE